MSKDRKVELNLCKDKGDCWGNIVMKTHYQFNNHTTTVSLSLGEAKKLQKLLNHRIDGI